MFVFASPTVVRAPGFAIVEEGFLRAMFGAGKPAASSVLLLLLICCPADFFFLLRIEPMACIASVVPGWGSEGGDKSLFSLPPSGTVSIRLDDSARTSDGPEEDGGGGIG